MEYSEIGIMMLRACNASCEICCIESNPGCKEKLNAELVKKYIHSTMNLKQIVGIGLTGGEVFLEYDQLKELVKYIAECGKNATVMTNCFWAKNYETAYRKLYELKKLGLTALGVSFDYYHNQYVSELKVRNALKAARQLSIATAINTVRVAGRPMGDVFERLGDDLLETVVQSFPCYPVGGAKKSIPDEEFIRRTPSSRQRCRSGGTFSIKYDGNIYPCCSPYVFETELSFGNYETSTAADTLKKMKISRIMYVLRNYGFDYFIRIAKNKLGIEVPDYSITSCELCALFFSKKNINRFYPYVYETTEMLINKQNGKMIKEI
ncbi:MAG: radical SAM protein [Anaerocolumna sp.]